MNYYFLASGILSLILSIAHVSWGESQIVPDLSESNAALLSRVGFYIVWNQIAVMLFISGVALIVFAIRRIAGARTAAIVMLCIVVGNFVTFLVIIALKMPPLLAQSIPQHVAFIALITLMLLGIRKAGAV